MIVAPNEGIIEPIGDNCRYGNIEQKIIFNLFIVCYANMSSKRKCPYIFVAYIDDSKTIY